MSISTSCPGRQADHEALENVLNAKIPRTLALLALCLLLGACSTTTRFFYNRLDIVLPWYAERYVDLNGEQRDVLDAQLEEMLEWHRRDELPRYVLLLDDILGRLDGEPTEQDVIELSNLFEDAWIRLRDRALDELLLLGGELRDDQMDEFVESLQKRQDKYERKYLPRDDEEFREEAYDDFAENLEDYLGRLSKAQKAAVEAAVEELIRADDLWLSQRQVWIDRIAQELRREPGWQGRIRQLVRNWESELDDTSTAAYDHNALVVQRAVATVVEMRSDKQDAKLRGKLRSLRDDLEVLHVEGEAELAVTHTRALGSGAL